MINRHVVGYKRYICSNEAWKLARFLSVTWTGGQFHNMRKKKNRFHTDCLIFIVHSKKRRSWSTYLFLYVQRVLDFLRFLLPLLPFTKILWLARIKFFSQWKNLFYGSSTLIAFCKTKREIFFPEISIFLKQDWLKV